MPERREAHPADSSFPIPTRFRSAELTELDRVADQLGIRRSEVIRRATLAFVGLIPSPGDSVPPTKTHTT